MPRPPQAIRGHSATEADAGFIRGRKSPYDYAPPHAPIDLPDDFGLYDDRPSFPITLLTGLGIGILLGLAWGQVWAMMGGLS